MVDTLHDSGQRREARYPVYSHLVCDVRIERQGEAEPETLAGELIDLSRGGAKLLVDACLQLTETVQLRIRIPDLSLEIDVTAQVCWTRPDDHARWLVGFSFTPSISKDVLQQLAVHSIVERRRSPRHVVVAKGSVSWQSQDQFVDVQLRDISAGGFCMSCDQKLPLGDKVLLRLPTSNGSDETITAQVRWQITCGQQQLVGCALTSNKDYRRLREAVRHVDVGKGKSRSSRRRFLGLRRSQLGLLVVPILGAAALAIVLSLSGTSTSSGIVGDSAVPPQAMTLEVTSAPVKQIASTDNADSQPEPTVPNDTLRHQQRRRWHSLLGETFDDLGSLAGGSDSPPPMPAPMPAPTPAPPTPVPDEPADAEPATTNVPRAVDAFARGDRAYRAGRYQESLTAFQEAVRHDASNPLYHYLLALAQYQLGHQEDARRSAETGFAREGERPLANWDRSLERYQDGARRWLEAWRATRSSTR